jgi:Putative auto-transporter adhesin, head GIN domain
MQIHQLIACTCLAVAATSCSHFHDDIYPTAPTSATVVGSGRVITEVRPVSGFTAIAVSGAVQAVVTPGGNDSLEITAEDNIAPFVETVVTGGRLTIGFRPGTPSISTGFGVVCRIGSRSPLRDIQLSGASRVQLDGIEAQELSVSLVGASSFTGSGTAEQLRMDVSGASRFTAPSLRARTADATLSGASTALVRVIDALAVRVSGASLFEYFGDPVVRADTSGTSTVRRVGS